LYIRFFLCYPPFALCPMVLADSNLGPIWHASWYSLTVTTSAYTSLLGIEVSVILPSNGYMTAGSKSCHTPPFITLPVLRSLLVRC
jgi:hypothetical protein